MAKQAADPALKPPPTGSEADQGRLKTLTARANKAADITLTVTPLLMIIVIAAILGIGVWGQKSDEPLLTQLANPGSARALITLLFAVGTIWIAVLLAVAALSSACSKESFDRGKEVLTVLVGILGTIIGFYFGAENERAKQPPTPPAAEAPADAKAAVAKAAPAGKAASDAKATPPAKKP